MGTNLHLANPTRRCLSNGKLMSPRLCPFGRPSPARTAIAAMTQMIWPVDWSSIYNLHPAMSKKTPWPARGLLATGGQAYGTVRMDGLTVHFIETEHKHYRRRVAGRHAM